MKNKKNVLIIATISLLCIFGLIFLFINKNQRLNYDDDEIKLADYAVKPSSCTWKANSTPTYAVGTTCSSYATQNPNQASFDYVNSHYNYVNYKQCEVINDNNICKNYGGSTCLKITTWTVSSCNCPTNSSRDSSVEIYCHCNPGYYETNGKCSICPIGYFCMGGGFEADKQQCEGNEYSDITGLSKCKTCPTGQKANANHTGCISSTTDSGCPAGKGKDISATTGCSNCSAGYYSGDNDNTCHPCAVGYYSSAGQSSCSKCSTGYTTSGTGKSSCDSCATGYTKLNGKCVKNTTTCGAGQYLSNGKCINCSAGYYSKNNDNECHICDYGYYSKEGSASCTKCPSGQVSNISRTSCYTPSTTIQEYCYKDVNNNYYYGNYNNQTEFTKTNLNKSNCNNIKIIKIDDNGSMLNGAIINFTDKTNNKTNTYTIGEQNINELQTGTYEIKEMTAPSNYELNTSVLNIIVSADGIINVSNGNNIELLGTNGTRNVIIKIKNNLKKQDEEKCYISNNTYCFGNQSNCMGQSSSILKSKCNSIKLTMVDENSNILNGATFVLQNSNGIQINSLNLGEKNIVELETGTYILKQTSAPTNYDVNIDEIKITIDTDGIINVSSISNIAINNNNSRNIDIKIQNSLSSKEEKCYVKYGIDSDNNYCYGTEENCNNYDEILESKTKDTCSEIAMCYKNNDKYIMGKYNSQKDYTLYGTTCPACYKDSKGNYRWTANPNNDESIDSNINVENNCTTPKPKTNINILMTTLYIALGVVVAILLFRFMKMKKNYIK